MERDDDVLLPFGVESVCHGWLHGACWKPWRDWREREAVAALVGLGVKPNTSKSVTERSASLTQSS
jgi:hypothetical protein